MLHPLGAVPWWWMPSFPEHAQGQEKNLPNVSLTRWEVEQTERIVKHRYNNDLWPQVIAIITWHKIVNHLLISDSVHE